MLLNSRLAREIQKSILYKLIRKTIFNSKLKMIIMWKITHQKILIKTVHNRKRNEFPRRKRKGNRRKSKNPHLKLASKFGFLIDKNFTFSKSKNLKRNR